MKKRFLILFSGLLFCTISCSDDLSGLNDNDKGFEKALPEGLMTNAQKEYGVWLMNTNSNRNLFRLFAQHWTGISYPDESNYNITTRNVAGRTWSMLYKDILKDLDEAHKLILAQASGGDTAEDVIRRKNKLAILEIQSVVAWQSLIDVFGNVPYSQALDINNISPQYDDAATIYTDLIRRLNTAILDLDPDYGSFTEPYGNGSADLIFRGDAGKWLTYGNSIKLRMGMLLADSDPALSKTLVEEAYTSGVISNPLDNATITYSGSFPNTHPLWADLVQSNRRDFAPADTYVNALNGLNDPRRDVFFVDKLDGAYVGALYGALTSYANTSHIGRAFFKPDLEGVLFDYSEASFLLAEAAERGYSVGGNAETLYNQAITANMNYWGIPDSDISAYLAQPEVAYTTAAGSYKQKIGVQSWIALYNRGFEAWTVFRRLDAPALVAPPTAQVITTVPVRFTYPLSEQTQNGANWSAAAAAIGGDKMDTKLFWDVN